MKPRRIVALLAAVLAVVALVLVAAPRSASADTCTSQATGNWNSESAWSCGHMPTSADSVIIASDHTITLDISAPVSGSLLGLTVNGTLIVGSDTAARTLTVAGDVTISSGATVQPNNPGNAVTHSLSIGGNLTNDGTFDAANSNGLINVTFNGGTNQTISGNGVTTDFNLITVNNTGASGNNIVEVTSSAFTVPTGGFLTLTAGVFKVSGSFTLSNRFFSTAAYSIPAGAGLWLNNANVTVTAQNGTPTLSGLLRITCGVYNVGTSSGRSLVYGSGAVFTMEGGALNIAGRFSGTATTQTIKFSMSGGTLTVAIQGQGQNSTGSFDISASGSSFTMSAGTIVLQRESAASTTQLDYRNVAGTANITGGAVQFGNASTSGSPSFEVGVSSGSASVFPDLTINADGTPSVNLHTAIAVNGNVTIGNDTTLAANAQNISLSGHWTNSGGTFTPGTGTVTLNGPGAQSIGGSVPTTFNNLTINQAGGVTLAAAATVNGLLSFGASAGLLRLGDFDLTLGPAAPAISGVFGGARMIIADAAGSLCKRYPTVSAYDFPIGDVTGTADYAPVTAVTVGGSASGSPSICFRVTDAAYPHKPGGATTWITRYWTGAVLPAGSSIANLACGATFNFVPDDPSGGADLMDGKKWDGATWATLKPVSGTSFTGSDLNSLSDFTAYNSSPLAVTLADFSAAQAGAAIVLTWETHSELNNRGFNLWRSTSPARPDLKLNDTLIPSQSQGLPGSGFQYTWADSTNLVPGTTYNYWLEDLDVNDTLTRHEPVTVTYGGAPTAVALRSLSAGPASGLEVTTYAVMTIVAALALLAVADAVRATVRRRR